MATFPGSRQYDDEFLVASDPGSTWYTTNNVAYMDQSKVERPQQTDVKILHKVRKPRQRESHYARDAREALKGTAKRNMATMPAAGVPYGHACAPRVTEDGLGVAEVGYPFGTPFIDMKQRRFGNCAGGTTHSKPMRSQTVTGYRADETVQWLKRHKADRHLDVQSIAQKVDQKLQAIYNAPVDSQMWHQPLSETLSSQAMGKTSKSSSFLGLRPVTTRHTHGRLPGVKIPIDCNRIYYEAKPNRYLMQSLSLF